MLKNVTVVVVGFNEAAYLHDCLVGLSFCEKVIYLDLGSKDDSLQIAKSISGVSVQQIDRVPVVEIIHAQLEKYVDTDWVLLIDPDQHISNELQEQIQHQFTQITKNKNVGVIEVPEFYFYKRKKLVGTVWGGLKYRNILVRRSAIDFSPNVHVGRKLHEGVTIHRIEDDGDNFISHYWADSYFKLLGKHIRYVKREGPARIAQGKTTKLDTVWRIFPNEFLACYLRLGGRKDGLNGFLLSLLWAWYQTAAEFELYKAIRNKA